MLDARTLTRELGGRSYGSGSLCFCPAHANTRTPALSASNGRDGRLLLYCHAGCSYTAIVNALRALGLLEGKGSYAPPSREELIAIRETERQAVQKRARQALTCWQEAQPIAGTPAEVYLREVRLITAALPPWLRFHPACWHGPSARRLPAMVAMVQGVDLPATHRTFLAPDGSGKASVEPNKMMLGVCAGGHVELVRSEGPLVICEGIETGLALASGLLAHPATIWAALSASGMAAVRLPASPGRLTVATDGDAAGSKAGTALATRAAAAGWRVAMLAAPPGQDWADVLETERGAA